jgi:hypothetical protein
VTVPQESPKLEPTRTFFVVSGAAFSGKTTVAAYLASRHQIPLIALRHLLQHVTSASDMDQALQADAVAAGAAISAELLARVITARLAAEDCEKGAVIDSLDCPSIAAPEVAETAVISALQGFASETTYVGFIGLKCPLQICRRRQQERQEEAIKNHQLELLSMRKIGEVEYESLSPSERAKYDAAFRELKRMKRATLSAKKLQRDAEQPQAQQQQQPRQLAPPGTGHAQKRPTEINAATTIAAAAVTKPEALVKSPITKASPSSAGLVAPAAGQRRKRRVAKKKDDILAPQQSTDETTKEAQPTPVPEAPKDPFEVSWLAQEERAKAFGVVLSTALIEKNAQAATVELDSGGASTATFAALGKLLPLVRKIELTAPTEDRGKPIPEPKVFEVVDRKYAVGLTKRQRPLFISIRSNEQTSETPSEEQASALGVGRSKKKTTTMTVSTAGQPPNTQPQPPSSVLPPPTQQQRKREK